MSINIESNKLLPLIKSFYELSGMKIAIFDNDFREVLTYPENSSAFCEAVWKCCGRNRCDEFTADMCRKSAVNQETLVYTCHAGLTEVVSPLKEKGRIFGYAVCGQVTNSANRDAFVEDVLIRCKNFGMEPERIRELLNSIQYRSDSHIEATLQIVNALASYIILQKLIYVSEKPVALRIGEYINENLGEDLSVDSICRKFAMSRSNLYSATKEFMPQGIAKYVRKCRVDAVIVKMEENPDKPLWRIAREVGFENYEYFLRVLKQQTGKSVKDFERKGR